MVHCLKIVFLNVSGSFRVLLKFITLHWISYKSDRSFSKLKYLKTSESHFWLSDFFKLLILTNFSKEKSAKWVWRREVPQHYLEIKISIILSKNFRTFPWESCVKALNIYSRNTQTMNIHSTLVELVRNVSEIVAIKAVFFFNSITSGLHPPWLMKGKRFHFQLTWSSSIANYYKLILV